MREARVLCTGVLPWAAEHHARTFSDIDEVDDVVEIAVDDQTLCALTTRGDVWCRSPGPEHHDDRWLRLGDGIRIAIGGDRLAIARRGARLTVAPLDATEPPSDIRPFDATADLAASLGVACGLSGSGRLLCRGTHAGSESGLQFPAPARAVAFDLGVLQVLEAEGVVREQDFVPSPEQAELTAGPYTDPIRAVFSSCALREDGSAQCPSRSGRLWTQLPAGLVTGPRIVEVARNFTTACALDDRDQLYCWGDDDGILGVRTEARRVEDVVGVTDAIDVVVGENHGCALLRNGEVRCWGGPFGAPTRAIVGLDDMLRSPIRALASTDLMVCALGAGGDVVCWGRRWPTRDEDLEGPEGHRPLVPLTLVPMPRVDEITAAMSHMCARAEGHVSCWRDGAPAEIGALAGADCRFRKLCGVRSGNSAVSGVILIVIEAGVTSQVLGAERRAVEA